MMQGKNVLSSLVLPLLFSLQTSATALPLRRRAQSSSTPLVATQYGTLFDIEVQVGNQTFLLLWDTGSADLWMIEPDFQCLNKTTMDDLPQSACTYAEPYYPSSTFEPVTNETFAVQYGSGNAVGTLGFDTVTVGNITVPKQKIGLVNMTTDVGDGSISGIIGFGHPVLTSAHPADFNFTNTSFLTDKVIYNPFFNNAYEQGLVDPYFSVALDRLPVNTSTGPGGYVALGSLPPVSHEPAFVTVPAEVNAGVPLSLTGGVPIITLWTLTVNSTVTANQTNTTVFQAVVDSGNPANVYPSTLAASVNAAFVPPAAQIPSTDGEDLYMAECDAVPPAHGITIGEKTFYMRSEDMIIQTEAGCVSSIMGLAPNEDGLVAYFLGAAWMRNVVSVFDFGKTEMRFAARTEDEAEVAGLSETTGAAARWGQRSLFGMLGIVIAIFYTTASF